MLKFVLVAASLVAWTIVPVVQQVRTFDDLEHRTGWICLGLIDATYDEHMLMSAPVAVEETAPREHRFKLARAGYVIELLRDEPLLIRDYKTRGEEERLWAPVRYPEVLESERGADETGIILPAKSRFLLAVVAKSPPSPRGTMGVFGRLEPAPPIEYAPPPQ